MQLMYRVGTFIASAGLVGSIFAAGASANNAITYNGANSTNNISVTSNCTINVSQRNRTSTNVSVNLTGNTGNNTANNNNNGPVNVSSGNVTQSINVSVGGGMNDATVPSCCDCVNTTAADNTIDNNAANSNSNITVNKTQNITVRQRNRTRTRVSGNLTGNTGNNKANNNNGNGTVNVTTGDVNQTVDVNVTAPSNTL